MEGQSQIVSLPRVEEADGTLPRAASAAAAASSSAPWIVSAAHGALPDSQQGAAATMPGVSREVDTAEREWRALSSQEGQARLLGHPPAQSHHLPLLLLNGDGVSGTCLPWQPTHKVKPVEKN